MALKPFNLLLQWKQNHIRPEPERWALMAVRPYGKGYQIMQPANPVAEVIELPEAGKWLLKRWGWNQIIRAVENEGILMLRDRNAAFSHGNAWAKKYCAWADTLTIVGRKRGRPLLVQTYEKVTNH